MAGTTSSMLFARQRGTIEAVAGVVASGGLPAGLAGIAVLLTLIFATDVPLLAAVLLTAGAYVGVALVRGSRLDREIAALDDRNSPIVTAFAHVATLRRLQDEIAKAEVRGQVGRIAASAERVACAIREDEDHAAARFFDEQVLVPVVALLTEYVRLTSRGVVSAASMVERTESLDLPLVEQTIDDIYERLHRAHLANLATAAALLELNLERVANAISRRGRS
jgi:hypothetical protein